MESGKIYQDFLIMHVTRACNQDCRFCCYPKKEIVIDKEKALALIDEYSERMGEIVFSGGEATLVKELTDYISYAKTKGLRTRVITNGMNLSEMDYCRELLKAGIDHVTISLQTLDQQTQEALTGVPGSLARTIKAIENLISLGSAPSIMTTLNAATYKKLPAFAKEMNKRYPEIKTMIFILLEFVGALRKNPHLRVRLSDLEPYLIQTLDFLSKKGYKLDIDGVPFCYLGDHRDKATEYNQVKNSASYFVYDLETDSCIGGTFKDKIKKLYTKGPICKECMHDDQCPGVNKNYNKVEGTSELYPVFRK